MSYEVKDGGVVWTADLGINDALFTSANASTAVAVSGSPTAGEHLVITDIIVSVAAAMEVAFEEETSGTELVKFHMAQDQTVVISPRSAIVLPTADKRLFVDTDTAGSISVTVLSYSTTNGVP